MNIGLYQNFFMLIRTYQLKEHQHTWLIYWLYLIHKEFWLCYLYKDQIGLLFISFFGLVDCSPFFLLLLFFPSEVFSMYTNFVVHGYSHSYIFYVFCRYCLNKKFFSICIWSCFPDCWRVLSMIPVYKNVRGRSVAKNYVLVCLFSLLVKIFGNM